MLQTAHQCPRDSSCPPTVTIHRELAVGHVFGAFNPCALFAAYSASISLAAAPWLLPNPSPVAVPLARQGGTIPSLRPKEDRAAEWQHVVSRAPSVFSIEEPPRLSQQPGSRDLQSDRPSEHGGDCEYPTSSHTRSGTAVDLCIHFKQRKRSPDVARLRSMLLWSRPSVIHSAGCGLAFLLS